jgi:hypothetical protein
VLNDETGTIVSMLGLFLRDRIVSPPADGSWIAAAAPLDLQRPACVQLALRQFRDHWEA